MKYILEKRGDNIYLYRSSGFGMSEIERDYGSIECKLPAPGEVVCLNTEADNCYFIFHHFEFEGAKERHVNLV